MPPLPSRCRVSGCGGTGPDGNARRICSNWARPARAWATRAVWMPWNNPSSQPTSWACAIRSSASLGVVSSLNGSVRRSSSLASSGARPCLSSSIEVWWIARSRCRLASSSGAAFTSASSCRIMLPIRITFAGCSTISVTDFGSSSVVASSRGGPSTAIACGVTTYTRPSSVAPATPCISGCSFPSGESVVISPILDSALVPTASEAKTIASWRSGPPVTGWENEWSVSALQPYADLVMHDFPPLVPDFAGPEVRAYTTNTRRGRSVVRRRLPARDFSNPDTRSGTRFLGWLLWQQLPVLLLSSLISVIEWLPGSVGPYLVGKIVDDGIIPHDLATVGQLSLIMFGLVVAGIIASVLSHTLVVRTWLVAMYGSMKLVTRKAAQLGHVLPRRTPTGEVLSVSAGDSDEFGALTEIVSRFVGALIAYLVIAGLVLSTSVKLGIVVLITAPLIALFAMPLLRPLQRREEIERTRTSDLTSMATDIVAGLRILRGIGGEQTFARNYTDQSQWTRKAAVSA